MFDRSHNGCINYLQDWILTLISLRGEKFQAICNIEIYREAMPYNINWIDLASRGVSHPAQDLCAFTTSKGEVIQGHRAMKISIAATLENGGKQIQKRS